MSGSTGDRLQTYRHETHPKRVVLTDDTGRTLRDETQALGLGRALIVCSERTAKSPFGQGVVGMLDEACASVFAGVMEHPTLAAVEQGATLAREKGADCLISLGGGSAVDLAKGIALRLVEEPPLSRLALNTPGGGVPGPRRDGSLVPILAVPRTLSGAECTPGTGLRDDHGHKLLIRDPDVVPRVVVLDPVANRDVPTTIMLPTGINAIAHCVEALYSLVRDPISDAYAIQGLALLHRGLSAMLDDANNVAARTDALNGAHLAGRAIANARTAIHHAACHVIGAAGVPHGVANAILLPHAIRFNAEAGGAHLAAAAHALSGGDENPAGIVATAVEDLSARAGLPYRLRDVGIRREQIPALASAVTLEPGLRFNPRRGITENDVIDLLTRAW